MVARSAGRKGRRHRTAKTILHKASTRCWLCGHDGAYELDHDPPRKVLLVWGLDPDDPRYHKPAHGTSCPCPTCGQRCNQVKGDRANRRPRMIHPW
ncbi:hypothetical protein [Micromonospora tulbaghiae]|uniref:hypothetical protein n=1 Tax=Micromonospora tulbaghiae TaxID=479978 RepID=UPI001FD106B3|nr:hypothetical protein [Micromonospora tulbaghiae]